MKFSLQKLPSKYGQSCGKTAIYPVGLKTGTAEQGDGTDNSLLVGFCDDSNLPIAFCIEIENWNQDVDTINTNNIARTLLNALSQ